MRPGRGAKVPGRAREGGEAQGAGGRRQGRVQEVMGVLEPWRGWKRPQEARQKVVNFWAVAENREVTLGHWVTISVNLC